MVVTDPKSQRCEKAKEAPETLCYTVALEL
jgi:hypothetical protein